MNKAVIRHGLLNKTQDQAWATTLQVIGQGCPRVHQYNITYWLPFLLHTVTRWQNSIEDTSHIECKA